MNCYPETVLRRFASGELDEPGMREVLRHVENCPRCHHALVAAERNVEKQLLKLADRKDWFPPHPRRLKARVHAAVADDCIRRARQAGARRHRWRIAPALAAAAVLLLILGARYLGEPRWNGRLEPIRGALLLSPSGESFSLTAGLESLPPGGLIMVPAGGRADLEFEDGNRFELTDSALAVLGSTQGGPRVSLARGIARVYGQPGGGLLVEAGGHEILVNGECEIVVECASTADALTFARRQSDRFRSGVIASLFPSAVASPGSMESLFSIQVRAIHGSVSLSGDRLLATAGRQVSRTGSTDWSSPVRSATQRIRSSRLLTAREMRAVPPLLSRHGDAIRSLLGAARDDHLSPWRRGLAVWLLGEFGDRRALPALTRLLAPGRGAPTVVRAAAVRSISLLGGVDPVLEALLDTKPAVAEAAILSLSEGSGEHLADVARSGDRPQWQRALAARRADSMGVDVGIPTLLALLGSADPDVRTVALALIGKSADDDGVRIVLDLARRGSTTERVNALDYLAKRKVHDALPIALEGARQSSSPSTRAASLRLLARLSPDAIDEFADDALTSADAGVRTAILWGLTQHHRHDGPGEPRNRQALTRIALSAWSPPQSRVAALRLLADPEIVSQALGEDPDPDFLLAVLQYRVAYRLPFKDIALIRTTTRHSRADLRIAAIHALFLEAPEEAAGVIEKRLRDGSSDSAALLNILTSTVQGRPVAAAEGILISLLLNPQNSAVRRRAADHLMVLANQASPPAIAALLSVAGDSGEATGVRTAAILALERAPGSGPMDSMLMEALQSTDHRVAVSAARIVRARSGRDLPIGIEILPSIRSDRARALLIDVVPARPDDIRGLLRSDDEVAAAMVLGDLPEEALASFLPEIEDLTCAADPLLRTLALCRLPETKGDRGLLILRLKDPDPLVRLTATGALIIRGVHPEPDETFSHLRRAVLRHRMPALLPLAEELAGGKGRHDIRPLIRDEVIRRIDPVMDDPLAVNSERSYQQALSAERRLVGERAASDIKNDDIETDQLLQAVSELAWAGERADIAPLIALASRSGALRETCGASVKALLGRSNAGVGGGPDLQALDSWWEERCYALDVPSSNRWKLSTRQ